MPASRPRFLTEATVKTMERQARSEEAENRFGSSAVILTRAAGLAEDPELRVMILRNGIERHSLAGKRTAERLRRALEALEREQ